MLGSNWAYTKNKKASMSHLDISNVITDGDILKRAQLILIKMLDLLINFNIPTIGTYILILTPSVLITLTL